MNEALMKSILGKFEKSFYDGNGFDVSGSAVRENRDAIIETSSKPITRYLRTTFVPINKFLNCEKDKNYLDPNDTSYDRKTYSFEKGTSNFPLENIISDIFNIVQDMSPLENPTTLYRGTFDHFYPELDKALIGQTISLKGITSTSTNLDVAEYFANIFDNTDYNGSLLFKINAPKGMPCIKVNTELFSEDEFILHPAEYKIVDIEQCGSSKCYFQIVTLEPCQLLDIKQIVLDGLAQAKENCEDPVAQWITNRGRTMLKNLKINPDTAIDDLTQKVQMTPSPSPNADCLIEPETM